MSSGQDRASRVSTAALIAMGRNETTPANLYAMPYVPTAWNVSIFESMTASTA